MKKLVKLMLVGLAATTATIGVRAQTYEQNVNVALIAQVQTADNTVKKVALNTKAIISLLSGIDNIVTNNFDLFVTNSVDTPEPLPAYPFPSSVVASDNYVITVDGQTYTNNMDFTNAIAFTQINTSPVTYVFNNAVTVGDGITGYYLPEFPADLVTAELVDTNGPAYHLYGSTVSPQTTPTFSSTAKLLAITDLNSGFQSFVVREGSRGATVDTDVSAFFGLYAYQEVSQSRGTGSTIYGHIDFSFNNTKGDSFDSQGEATETESALRVRGTDYGTIRKTFNATVGGSGAAATAPLGAGTMVLGGKISMSAGKFVAGTPTP